jgi:hypothetical protein
VDGLLATFGEAVRVRAGASVFLLITLGSMVVAWASRSERARHLVISLAVPWAILALVAEPGKTERFLWLWPLQVIFVAAGVRYVMSRLNVPRQVAWGLQLVLVLLLVADPVQVRINEWLRSGWEGPDAEEVLVVDYAATHLRAEGMDVAAIGYETFVYPFMARYHAIDPHYKVGAEFDLLFRYRYGIVNLDTCAEGVSPADDYRIVQERPQVAPGAPVQFFDVPSDGSFQQVGGVASYSLLRRD